MFISLAMVALCITCLVWLFMVYSDAKDEPNDRVNYILDTFDIEEYKLTYGENDYCVGLYDPYIQKGAFDYLDVRMKNIKKFSLGLIILNFISLGLEFLTIIIVFTVLCCESRSNTLACIIAIITILNLLTSLVAFILFIILSVHYFKSDFDEFEKFSGCEYLNSKFDHDYKFVNEVKDNYLKYFIVYFVIFGLNSVNNSISRCNKKD